MASVLKSRALGSIWGVCVCDALGGPVQFLEQGSFEPIKGMEYVTPFQQPAGYFLSFCFKNSHIFPNSPCLPLSNKQKTSPSSIPKTNPN